VKRLESRKTETPWPSIFDELPSLAKAGIPTIKLFMAYKVTPFYSDDATVFQMLQKSREVGMER
jgi:dihydropyrimidinase